MENLKTNILYQIEGDKITAPISIEYSFSGGYIDSVSHTLNAKYSLRPKYRESVNDLIEDFMNNPFLFSDFLYKIELHKHDVNVQLNKSVTVNFSNEWEPYRIYEELYDNKGIYQLILNHPKYEEYRKVVETLRKEQEELSHQTEKERYSTVKKNNFEMWKILHNKMLNGEFDEYIKTEQVAV